MNANPLVYPLIDLTLYSSGRKLLLIGFHILDSKLVGGTLRDETWSPSWKQCSTISINNLLCIIGAAKVGSVGGSGGWLGRGSVVLSRHIRITRLLF